MRCRTCNKKLEKPFKKGIYQVGQGNNKPLLTFCKEKCYNQYEKYKVKGWLWKLKGTTPKTDKNTMKCKNCGKLRENHYKSTEKEKGGRWCYIFEDFPPENKKYYMQYKNCSQSHGGKS